MFSLTPAEREAGFFLMKRNNFAFTITQIWNFSKYNYILVRKFNGKNRKAEY